MKKIILFLILFLFSPFAYAKNIIIPNDIVSGMGKIIEYSIDVNFIEKFLLNQILRNSSVNGIKLKKCSVQNLIEYFNEDKIFKKAGSNKLIEPITGVTLEFKTDNKCRKKNKCAIIVDLGNNSPLIFKLQNKRSGLSIELPEISD